MSEVQFAVLLSTACAITNHIKESRLFEGLSWAYLGVAAWKALS
jgi:hypothetical protein